MGPDLSTVAGSLPTFPFTQNFIDRAIRGDYFNVFAVVDLTVPASNGRCFSALAGAIRTHRWCPHQAIPHYLNYTYNPSESRHAAARRPRHRSPAPIGAPAPLAPDMSAIAPVDQPHRPAGADADTLRPNSADDLHDRVGDRHVRDGLRYLQVPTSARDRPPHSELGTAHHRRPLSVQQCHLPRRANRQGHRGGSTATGAEATLSIDTSPKIPADLQASAHSMSAVGEQYVDLVPRSESAPYLRDGSVIALRDTTIPQPVGPMLDRLSALVNSIPKDKLTKLLDESFKAFNGAGYDFGSLLDSSAKVLHDANATADHTRALIDDAGPCWTRKPNPPTRSGLWAHSLAGVTGQLVTDDPQFRNAAAHRTRLRAGGLEAAQPDQTDPAGAAGQPHHHRPDRRHLSRVTGTTPGAAPAIRRIHQLLWRHQQPDWPRDRGICRHYRRPAGLHRGIPAPSQWRSPADTTEIDTPDGLYCKLPQDSPIAVRGARNYPCMGHPENALRPSRSATATSPYEPLAQRQHVLGPTRWIRTCYPKAFRPMTG